MYDSMAILKGTASASYDAYGNEVITQTQREVYVQPRSVYASEFYSAAQAGMHPSITFALAHRDEYQGEKIIEWGGKDYTVIRADWTAQRDRLVLVCEERIGNE